MNWKEYYKQHLMSAEDAVNHIQSGNRVVVAHACGEPSYLLDVMVANAKAYKDVEIVHMVLMRVYTDGMNIKEKRVDKRRGVLILYALPDTVKLGLSEAQTYNVIWNTFHKIQQTAPTAMVYYGQETGEKAGKSFDEIGVLLPVHQFEKKMLMHLSEIDGIVLACREEMMKKAGSDSLDL